MSEPDCTCPGPGFCPRYNIEQSAHHVHLCRTRPEYRAKWARQARDGAVPLPLATAGAAPPPPKPSGGPGTELHGLLLSLGIRPQGCGCNSLAAKMDSLGVAWCREHRAELVEHLRAEAAKRSWWERLRAAGLAVVTGVAFRIDPADVMGSLLDEACRRAEKATTPHPAESGTSPQ